MRRGRHRQISDGATLGTAVFETVLNPNAMPAQRERHLGCSARLWRSLPGGADILVCLGSASAGCTHPAEPTRRNEEGTRMSLRRTGRQECLPHQVATNTSYTRHLAGGRIYFVAATLLSPCRAVIPSRSSFSNSGIMTRRVEFRTCRKSLTVDGPRDCRCRRIACTACP